MIKKRKTAIFNKFLTGIIFINFCIGCKAPKIISQVEPIIPTTKETNPLSIDLQNAHVGVCVYDVEKKMFLESYNSDKYFIPASNTKILTCYAALKYLGDSLVGVNFIEDDTSVSIQGTGDPSFLNKNFYNQPVFEWLKSKSNKKIYLYNSKFTTTVLGSGWSWDDYLEPYMAERSSFPLFENVVTFSYNNGFNTIPKYFENRISSTFDASNNIYQFSVVRKIGMNDFSISPGKNLSKRITFYTESENELMSNKLIVQLISDTLKQNIFSKPVPLNLNSNKIYSQSIDTVLKSMMVRSDNFIAEQLLLMSSNELFKEMNETKIIQYLLKNDLNELPQTPKWIDGSGLSRYNLVSPEDFIFILNKMKLEFSLQRITKIFPKGNEGTLKNMFINNTNQVSAKSGTLSNVYCLSGYLISNSGKEFIFSIMVNHYQLKTIEVKNAIEKYLTNIIEKN